MAHHSRIQGRRPAHRAVPAPAGGHRGGIRPGASGDGVLDRDLTPEDFQASFFLGLKPDIQLKDSVRFAASYEEMLERAQWQE